MRVTKAIIARAKRVEALQSTSYRVGTSDVVNVMNGELIGIYRTLGDFAYNKFGQTPRQACSFTASLAHLISVDPSFITAMSDEGAWYIGAQCVAEYERVLLEAAKYNGLQAPEGLEDAA